MPEEDLNNQGKKRVNWTTIFLVLGFLVLLLIAVLIYYYFFQQSTDKMQSGGGKWAKINSLADVSNMTDMEAVLETPLNARAYELLEEQNFVVRPSTRVFYGSDPEEFSMRADDWVELYSGFKGGDICERRPANSVFITSDFLLHVYHVLFDLQLKYLEMTAFAPKLNQLSEVLFNYSLGQVQTATDADQRASWERLSAFLAVGLSQFNDEYFVASGEYDETPQGVFVAVADPEKVRQKLNEQLCPGMSETACQTAKEELELLLAANTVQESPLFANPDMPTDYTQFAPRGHYNENAILQAYFRAMMWYGRSNFVLNGEDEGLNNLQTLDALNLAQAIREADPNIENDLYLAIKKPVDYLVGEDDDLSVQDYLEIGGGQELSLATVAALRPQLIDKSKQRIMSEVMTGEEIFGQNKEELQAATTGFHFFSQKFTPDAMIFTELTQGDERANAETGEKLPSLPTALMVPAVLGNEEAKKQLEVWIEEEAPDSKQVLELKVKELSDYYGSWTSEDWNKNNYTQWLAALGTLQNTPPIQEAIKSENWAKKELNTYLGSYAELKHDTLLYAKQSYAEMGAGGPECDPPAVPMGYVEPNLDLLRNLISMVNKNREMLVEYNLEGEGYRILDGRFEMLLEVLSFYRDIAEQELTGTKISEEDFESLRTKSGLFKVILMPLLPIETKEKDARSALVADVFTDAKDGLVLYEANAIPDEILMIVNDTNGKRIVRGLTYSYREFTGALGGEQRLNDELWQEKVYQSASGGGEATDSLPLQPNWYRSAVMATGN